jgi:hypothetical protein
MKPKTKDNYIGLEIECIFPRYNNPTDLVFLGDYDLYAAELRNWFQALNIKDHAVVGYDNSIEGREYDVLIDNPDWDEEYPDDEPEEIEAKDIGIEIRLLMKESEVEKILSKALHVVHRLKGYVNSSCGLHVHLDMRQRDFKSSLVRLYDMQTVMFDLVDESRIENKYCTPLTKEELDGILEYGHKNLDERYKSINALSMEEHTTIEVRLHHGTINYWEILPWIKWLVKVVDNKPISKWEVEYVNKRKKGGNLARAITSYGNRHRLQSNTTSDTHCPF